VFDKHSHVQAIPINDDGNEAENEEVQFVGDYWMLAAFIEKMTARINDTMLGTPRPSGMRVVN
jgi:hypothetical protein